jgi:hypothetical protein
LAKRLMQLSPIPDAPPVTTASGWSIFVESIIYKVCSSSLVSIPL